MTGKGALSTVDTKYEFVHRDGSCEQSHAYSYILKYEKFNLLSALSLCVSELWVYLYDQMTMIQHDFHLYTINEKLMANFFYKFFQAYSNTIDQDRTATNHMVFTRVHHIIATLIFPCIR